MMRFSNLIFISVWLVASAITGINTRCIFCFKSASPAQLANVSIRLYPKYGAYTIENYISLLVDKSLDLCDKFDKKKPTVLYISGWTETPESLSVRTVEKAYLERREHNVMVLDYSEIAAGSYTFAIVSAEGVCHTVAIAIDQLVDAGCLDPFHLHIIGHSLGGQIAGCIGRKTKSRIGRITGLDPAGPFFDPSPINNLSPKDAGFVDVIHTDAGGYGSAVSTGHVTFHPNGGVRVQSGCPVISMPFSNDDFCSHHRSWWYYAESVSDRDSLIGVQCDSKKSFENGLCSSNTMIPMGMRTPTTARGKFYLRTNSTAPFGLGKDGVNPKSNAFPMFSWSSVSFGG